MAFDTVETRQFSRRAMRAELLDAETEFALAVAWRDRRDEAALHRLVMAYMRLAISVAAKFRRYGAPMGDLIQEAGLGLMKAADRFDPDRGVRFSTYAVWWVKASVQDYVMRNWSMVRTGSTTNQKALFFNLRRVEAQILREARDQGEAPDAGEIRRRVAERLGVPEADVEMMDGRMSGGDLSLNARQAGDEEGREWIETLADEAPGAEDDVAARHDQARVSLWLAEALDVLSPREHKIIAARKLTDTPRTLESLGEELGLSKERVRQIEAAALGKMRRALESRAPEVQSLLS
ncbi:MAG: RNA polymerase factor sigma-32 [Pararhodobacter sp.]